MSARSVGERLWRSEPIVLRTYCSSLRPMVEMPIHMWGRLVPFERLESSLIFWMNVSDSSWRVIE